MWGESVYGCQNNPSEAGSPDAVAITERRSVWPGGSGRGGRGWGAERVAARHAFLPSRTPRANASPSESLGVCGWTGRLGLPGSRTARGQNSFTKPEMEPKSHTTGKGFHKTKEQNKNKQKKEKKNAALASPITWKAITAACALPHCSDGMVCAFPLTAPVRGD